MNSFVGLFIYYFYGDWCDGSKGTYEIDDNYFLKLTAMYFNTAAVVEL